MYDSLNRLIEKGFISKEPVKRGANYQIIPIEKIFKSIREEYKRKIDDTMILEKAISNLEIDQGESEPRVWSISRKDKIRRKIKELIESAQERLYFIITPDLLMSELGGYDWIMKELWNKKFSSEDMDMIVAFQYFDDILDNIRRLLNLNVDIRTIEGDTVIPFGLLISDNDFLLTTLDQVRIAPEYTTGLWLENGRHRQIDGYIHLFKHFVNTQCKTATFTKKKKLPAENIIN